MTNRTSFLAAGLAAAALAAGGCRSYEHHHHHHHGVYEVVTREAPVVHREVVRVVERPATQDAPAMSEAERRRWVEENYGEPAPAPEPRVVERRVVVRERYVPARETCPERVVVVERPRYYAPPVSVGLSWFHGHGWHGHHRRGWGWGVSLGW